MKSRLPPRRQPSGARLMAAGKGTGIAGLGFGLLFVLGACLGGSDGGSEGPYSSSGSAPTWTPSSSTPTAEREPQEWFYVHGPMNVRAEPGTDARVVRTLGRGDRVQLGPADANGWARLYGGAPEGYVYRASENVRADAPAAPRTEASSAESGRRGSSSGSRVYHTGPRGGCYYYSSSGRKQYVDRSYCR